MLVAWWGCAPPPQATTEGRPPSTVLRDGAGDVLRVTMNDNARPAGEQPTVDVTRVAIWHVDSGVVLRVRFLDLQRPHYYRSVGAVLTTPDAAYDVEMRSMPTKGMPLESLLIKDEHDAGCPAVRHAVDYRRDRVTLAVAGACLGNPEWVTVSVYNEWDAHKGPCFGGCVDNPHSRELLYGGRTTRLQSGSIASIQAPRSVR